MHRYGTYEVQQFNFQNSRTVSLQCWVRQTHVLRHIWTYSNLCLHETQTEWVVHSRAAEEVVRLWYMVGRKMSDKNLEQWINIRFCVKIGRSASEMLAPLAVAYSEYAMKKLRAVEWHRQFKDGWDVQDNPRSGQPKTHRTDAKVDRVWTLVCSDWRVGVRVTAE